MVKNYMYDAVNFTRNIIIPAIWHKNCIISLHGKMIISYSVVSFNQACQLMPYLSVKKNPTVEYNSTWTLEFLEEDKQAAKVPLRHFFELLMHLGLYTQGIFFTIAPCMKSEMIWVRE